MCFGAIDFLRSVGQPTVYKGQQADRVYRNYILARASYFHPARLPKKVAERSKKFVNGRFSAHLGRNRHCNGYHGPQVPAFTVIDIFKVKRDLLILNNAKLVYTLPDIIKPK